MNKLAKPAILSISLLIIMTGNAVSPALGEISDAFNDAQASTIKLVLTLPSFVIIPFSFISSKLSESVKKRRLIIIGTIIYLIGGVAGGFARTINELLLSRAVLGMGMGFLMPYTTSLIADFYKGTERTVMMGLSNAVANFGGIVATLIAGALAIYSWRYIFAVYSAALIVFLLIIFGLPEPPVTTKSNTKFSVNKKVIVIAILAFLLNIAFYSVITNISLFIKSENIGNSGYSGIANAFITLAGFVSGVCLRQISKFFKRFRVPFAITIMSLGFLLLSASYNITMILISNLMIGFGIGVLKPVLFLNVAEVTPKHLNAFAISIVSNSILLGKFVSPLFLGYLGEFFNNISTRFIFSSMGISLGLAAVISLISRLGYVKIFNLKYEK